MYVNADNLNVYDHPQIEKTTETTETTQRTTETTQSTADEHPVEITPEKRRSKVAALCLCLLSLILMAVVIGLVVQCFTDINKWNVETKQLRMKNNNLTLERDQLQTSYNDLTEEKNNLTLERDQLQTSYNDLTEEKNNLTLERDQLQTSYNDLTEEKNNLTLERNELNNSINVISQERDKWKTLGDNLTLERDQLQTSYNNLTEEKNNLTLERDQLQTSYNNLTEEKNNLTLERDQLQTSYNALMEVVKTACNDPFPKQNRLQNNTLASIDCPEGWRRFGCSCYYLSPDTEKKTWVQSRQDCQNRGYDLVVINSQEEMEFVRNLKQLVWIGLSEQERNWIWVDGTRQTEGLWAGGEPSDFDGEDCAEFNPHPDLNALNDVQCHFPHVFLCED
ncbi:uncharacterized protein ACJ7VT_018637 isoform 1-T1 [Polymixia lowei]